MTNEEVKLIAEEVCKDLLETLKKIKSALVARDANQLKEFSDHTSHCAAIYHEKRAVFIAMITYSLGQIVERYKFSKEKSGDYEDFIIGMTKNVEALITFLGTKNFKKFDDAMFTILKDISEFDASFGKYVEDVLEFSRIQKGAKVYEHGLSLSSIAEMIGVSKWDLMKKVGETKVHEEDVESPKGIKERFEKLKKLVNKVKK